MSHWFTRKTLGVLVIAMLLAMAVPWIASASDVNVAVVDVDTPTDKVTLAPGNSGNITINMTISGKQDGEATFKVYRDWSLSGGAFSGSNPQQFTVPARSASESATTFSTTGTVSVAAGQADGTFTLAVGAFDITNSNETGAKLSAGSSSNYQITVDTPVVNDNILPTITITTPANNAVYILNEEVYADYSCQDEAGGSGLKPNSCVGTVANGIAVDTSTAGVK